MQSITLGVICKQIMLEIFSELASLKYLVFYQLKKLLFVKRFSENVVEFSEN